jgi:hypothetical protein
MIKISFLLTMIFLFAAFARADTGTAGLPGEFLYDFSASAKGLGLGLAQTTLNGNSNVIYSNPAGIANLWWQEASITYVPLLYGSQFVDVSYGYPIKQNQVFGASIVRLGSGDAEKTNDIGQSIGTFTDQETALIMAYAYKLTPELFLGASAKVVMQDIDTYSQRGFGMDMGVMYKKGWQNVLGISLINALAPRVGPDTYPLVAKFGYNHVFVKDKLSLYVDLSAVNFLDPKNQITQWFEGVEYFLLPWLAVRGGYNQNQFSMGVGITTRKVDFDYAFTGQPLGVFHAITINVRYGFSPTEAEQEVERKLDDMKSEKDEYINEKRKEKEAMESERKALKLQMLITAKYLDARKKYEDGDYEGAAKLLREIVKLDGSNSEAHALLGEINTRKNESTISERLKDAKSAYGHGAYDEALKFISFVLELKPDNQEAQILGFLVRAQQFINDKKYRDAKGELIEVMKLDPNNKEASELLKRLQTIIDINDEK